MSLDLIGLVETAGPLVLIVMAAAETAFITGLVVPAGVATAFGAFLAADGHVSLSVVMISASAGALLGDSIGFWLGRRFGEGIFEGDGRLSALARRHRARADRFFQGHPIYSVTFARLVAFVRTLMPMAAGMTPIRYVRYLAYDIPGVAGWLAMYTAAGYLAGASWRMVAGAIGTGWAILFALVGLGWWLTARFRRLAEPGGSDPDQPEAGMSPETS